MSSKNNLHISLNTFLMLVITFLTLNPPIIEIIILLAVVVLHKNPLSASILTLVGILALHLTEYRALSFIITFLVVGTIVKRVFVLLSENPKEATAMVFMVAVIILLGFIIASNIYITETFQFSVLAKGIMYVSIPLMLIKRKKEYVATMNKFFE